MTSTVRALRIHGARDGDQRRPGITADVDRNQVLDAGYLIARVAIGPQPGRILLRDSRPDPELLRVDDPEQDLTRIDARAGRRFDVGERSVDGRRDSPRAAGAAAARTREERGRMTRRAHRFLRDLQFSACVLELALADRLVAEQPLRTHRGRMSPPRHGPPLRRRRARARPASSGDAGAGASSASRAPFFTAVPGRDRPPGGGVMRPAMGAPTSAEPPGEVSTVPETSIEPISSALFDERRRKRHVPLLLLQKLDVAALRLGREGSFRFRFIRVNDDLDAVDRTALVPFNHEPRAVDAGHRWLEGQLEGARPFGRRLWRARLVAGPSSSRRASARSRGRNPSSTVRCASIETS